MERSFTVGSSPQMDQHNDLLVFLFCLLESLTSLVFLPCHDVDLFRLLPHFWVVTGIGLAQCSFSISESLIALLLKSFFFLFFSVVSCLLCAHVFGFLPLRITRLTVRLFLNAVKSGKKCSKMVYKQIISFIYILEDKFSSYP